MQNKDCQAPSLHKVEEAHLRCNALVSTDSTLGNALHLLPARFKLHVPVLGSSIVLCSHLAPLQVEMVDE